MTITGSCNACKRESKLSPIEVTLIVTQNSNRAEWTCIHCSNRKVITVTAREACRLKDAGVIVKGEGYPITEDEIARFVTALDSDEWAKELQS